jgi:hypothetical protein
MTPPQCFDNLGDCLDVAIRDHDKVQRDLIVPTYNLKDGAEFSRFLTKNCAEMVLRVMKHNGELRQEDKLPTLKHCGPPLWEEVQLEGRMAQLARSVKKVQRKSMKRYRAPVSPIDAAPRPGDDPSLSLPEDLERTVSIHDWLLTD